MQDIAILIVALFVTTFTIAFTIIAILEVRRFYSWHGGTVGTEQERNKAVLQAIRRLLWASALASAIASAFLASTGVLAAILKAWLDAVLR